MLIKLKQYQLHFETSFLNIMMFFLFQHTDIGFENTLQYHQLMSNLRNHVLRILQVYHIYLLHFLLNHLKYLQYFRKSYLTFYVQSILQFDYAKILLVVQFLKNAVVSGALVVQVDLSFLSSSFFFVLLLFIIFFLLLR